MGATYRFPGVVRGNLRVTGSLTVGADVLLSRGAADRLDLASGDSLNIVSGSILVGGTTVVDSSRNITGASVVVGNITVGTDTISHSDALGGDLLLEGNSLPATGQLSLSSFRLHFNANGTNSTTFRISTSTTARLTLNTTANTFTVADTLVLSADLDHNGTNVGFYGTAPTAQGAAVADASGGATVDAEARTAINALLARVRDTGLIAT